MTDQNISRVVATARRNGQLRELALAVLQAIEEDDTEEDTTSVGSVFFEHCATHLMAGEQRRTRASDATVSLQGSICDGKARLARMDTVSFSQVPMPFRWMSSVPQVPQDVETIDDP